MNKKQGMNSINDQISYQEESPVIAPANFPRPRISELIEQKNHIDGASLVNEVLFSCHKCGGPMVPSSDCLVCNRTSLRKCARCENEIPNGSHQSCEYLILLSKIHSNQQKHEEVNS